MRKSPRKHWVHPHYREGKLVNPYLRGNGKHLPKHTKLHRTELQYPWSNESSRHLLNYNPKSQKMILMAPKEFLNLTIPHQYLDEALNTDVSDLEKLIQNKTPLELPFLDVDISSSRVTNHEGRHRSIAAYKLGITKIPVIVYYKDKGDFVFIEGKKLPNVFLPQRD